MHQMRAEASRARSRR